MPEVSAMDAPLPYPALEFHITSLMSSDAFFLPSISSVPGMTQGTPRMKFKSERYRFYPE